MMKEPAIIERDIVAVQYCKQNKLTYIHTSVMCLLPEMADFQNYSYMVTHTPSER